MNYKRPVIEKLKAEKNLEITTPQLGLMMAKFKRLIDYEFTNIELLVDFSQDILFDEFAVMISTYQSARNVISKF
jgi:hypothetical protein